MTSYIVTETEVEEGRIEEAHDEHGQLRVRVFYFGKPGEDVTRFGAPAEYEFHADGTLRSVRWVVAGRGHRIDGPARIYYDSGGSECEWGWRFRGNLPKLGATLEEGHAFVVNHLYRLSYPDLVTEFERSSYATHLAAGHPAERILSVLAQGVWQAESVGHVLAGAPAEWVRSFEEGLR